MTNALYACDKEETKIIEEKIEYKAKKDEKDKKEEKKDEKENKTDEGTKKADEENNKPSEGESKPNEGNNKPNDGAVNNNPQDGVNNQNNNNQPQPPKQEEKEEDKEETLSDMSSNVVVMYFTGQRCSYCTPKLTKSIKELTEHSQYSKNSIVVCLHGRPDLSHQLSNKQAVEYYKQSIIPNRGVPWSVYNNVRKYREPDYNNIKTDIAKKRILYTKAEAKLIEGGKSIEVSVTSKKVKNGGELTSKNLSVLLWVTENGVKGYQRIVGDNYIHNNIFRGYINGGMWGEKYKLGEKYTFKGQMPSNVLVSGNCDLIAIIVDTDTNLFIDAAKVKLK